MKKIIYSLLFAALFSACSTDFLDRNPLDKPSNEAFWRTEKEVQRPRPIRVIAIWGMETWFAIIISWRISIAPK